MAMVRGFVHPFGCDPWLDEKAVVADVHLVNSLREFSGDLIGYMELSNGDVVDVKKNLDGIYNGMISGYTVK